MDPIGDELLSSLAHITCHAPTLPVFASVHGRLLQSDEHMDAQYFWQNVRQGVMFAPAIRDALRLGYRSFVEIAPHPIYSATSTDS